MAEPPPCSSARASASCSALAADIAARALATSAFGGIAPLGRCGPALLGGDAPLLGVGERLGGGLGLG